MTDTATATPTATAKRAAPKPTARKTISTKQLCSCFGEKAQVHQKAGEILKDLAGLITKQLKKRERVKIAGLGSLQVRNRAARMGRNPATGEPIQIKASKKVAFRVTKELKMAI
jgi:DNA-binding protein HU-beta